MSGKTAAGLVLIVIGVVAALWGINVMNSVQAQIFGAMGMHDSTGPLAVGGGAVFALIGLALAIQRGGGSSATAFHSVRSTQSASRLAPSGRTPSKELLADLMAESRIISLNFATEDLLALVVGHLQAGNKINAIRALREVTGGGLNECKDLVDEVDRVRKNSGIAT